MASESDGYRTPQSRVGNEDNLSVEQEPISSSVTDSLNILIAGSTGSEEAIKNIQRTTTLFVEQPENTKSLPENVGLKADQVTLLIDSIVGSTNSEYSEESLKRSLDIHPKKKTFSHYKNSQIKVSPTILGLKPGLSKKLIEAMIPNSDINSESVVKLCSWALGNRTFLNETSVLLPVLKWANCILHYELCSIDSLETLYEIFLQSLDVRSIRSIVFDILYKVTGLNKSLVTAFRIRQLTYLHSKYGEMAELENLMKKYKMLKPHLVKTKFKVSKAVKTYLDKTSAKMERSFESCWGNRSAPLKKILNPSANYYRMESTTFGKIPLNHGNLAKNGIIPPTYYLETLKLSEAKKKSSAPKNSSEFKGKIKLSDCSTLGDMFANIHQLILPCQAISLIASPHLFYLVMLNPNATEVKERLSFTLYHTLHNEFLSQSSEKGDTRRKATLLSQINDLQEWLQSGIPIVYRFLAEYISTKWNGSDFFLEVFRLLAYLPITDFDELNDCILSHIRSHYNSKFTIIEQLIVLTYLHKLLTHWCVVEYERCLVSLGKQRPSNSNSHGNKGEPEKSRTVVKISNIWEDWGFFSRVKEISNEDDEGNYIGEDTYCENPLKAISELTQLFKQWTELALAKLIGWNKGSKKNSTSKLRYVFVNEVLLMYLSLSKCFVDKKIPIRPSIPSSVIYMCLFSPSVHFISLASQYISTMKNEVIPMIKNRENDPENDAIAFDQLDVRSLNVVSKDIIAVFANESVNINRGESIFKQHWDIEHEVILKELSLCSHPALLYYSYKFCKELAEEEQNCNYKEVYYKLQDPDSYEFKSYIDYLEKKAPNITQLYNAHRICYSTSVNVAHSTISNTTSGVSSMKPTKRPASTLRSTRKRRKDN